MVFVRPGQLRAAEWAEFDLDSAEWHIPAEKMTMKVQYFVPLSTQAVEILRALQPITGHGKYVVPSIRTGQRCMNKNSINASLRSLGYSKEMMTGHVFRAMARTILDEEPGERTFDDDHVVDTDDFLSHIELINAFCPLMRSLCLT